MYEPLRQASCNFHSPWSANKCKQCLHSLITSIGLHYLQKLCRDFAAWSCDDAPVTFDFRQGFFLWCRECMWPLMQFKNVSLVENFGAKITGCYIFLHDLKILLPICDTYTRPDSSPGYVGPYYIVPMWLLQVRVSLRARWGYFATTAVEALLQSTLIEP